MSQSEILSSKIPEELMGLRLDQALAVMFSDYSRARLQQWIRSGQVRVDGCCVRARDKVRGGECVQIKAKLEDQEQWQAEDIPLDIVYGDDHILVLNKPVGLVVHPAPGNRDGTLVNALLHYAPELARIPRAGVVHRLDKDTSGLLVVARTLSAHKQLVEQLQARLFLREYQALVVGVMPSGGTVDAPIGRHSMNRKRMAVVTKGKPAVTHHRVLERFGAHSHISLRLETGRTHQIRVHMAHIHYPIVGDPVYGGRHRMPADCSESLRIQLQGFRRQALHASQLGIKHPVSGEMLTWRQPLAADMTKLITALRDDYRRSLRS